MVHFPQKVPPLKNTIIWSCFFRGGVPARDQRRGHTPPRGVKTHVFRRILTFWHFWSFLVKMVNWKLFFLFFLFSCCEPCTFWKQLAEITPKTMKSDTFGTSWGQKLGTWRFPKFTILWTLRVHEKNSKSFFDLGFAENFSSCVQIIYFSPLEIAYDRVFFYGGTYPGSTEGSYPTSGGKNTCFSTVLAEF